MEEKQKRVSPWTPEKIEALVRLWATDLRLQEVADQIGVSRNSVEDKARRMKLPRKPSGGFKRVDGPISAEGMRRRKRIDEKREGIVPTSPPRIVFPVGPIFYARRCQWPLWSGQVPRPALFCGEPSVQGASYCADHREIVAAKPEDIPPGLKLRIIEKAMRG